ncbi:MAG TPA: hypothetical protein VGK74_04045 [Symbiobacteriaceae bacterium]
MRRKQRGLMCNLTEVGEPSPDLVEFGMRRWAELLVPHALEREQVGEGARRRTRQGESA